MSNNLSKNKENKDIDLELLANKIDIIYRSLPLLSRQLDKIESDVKELKRKKDTPKYAPPIDGFEPFSDKDDWWKHLEVKYGDPTCGNTSKDVTENIGVITNVTGGPIETIFDKFFGNTK